ncbi:tetratricopeptide repeat protein [soil metagenome]
MRMTDELEVAADPHVLYERGRGLHTERRYEEAVRCFREALVLDSALAEAHDALGRSLNNLRRFAEAEHAFRAAIRLRPEDAGMHNHLGHVLRAQGALEAAAAEFATASRLDPGFARAHHNLGTVRNAQGRSEEAIDCLRRGLEIAPGDAAGWANLGDLLRTRDRYDEAIEAYGHAVAADPRFADVHARLGGLLWDCGRLTEAMAAYEAALRVDPAHGGAIAGVAGALEVSGRYEEAQAFLEPFIPDAPDDAVVIAHARLLRRLGRREDAIERLNALVASASESSEHLVRARFTLGDLYDDLGDYERAFACYRAANEARAPVFRPAEFTEGVQSLIDFFTRSTLAELPRSGNESKRPVFIVGMPRSGTSLVEQILAAHSAVYACGERNDLYAFARNMSSLVGSSAPYPNCLRKVKPEQLAKLARRYLENSTAPDAGIERITDKLPFNFLNLGLIELLFPDSRIIHCRRHPLDTAISCYFQHFASRGLAFSDRLEHIGIYIQTYRRVMAHWRKVLEVPILDVDYEDLVMHPETVSRRLIEFLDLQWEPACLRFHALGRTVVTASYAQVREPVYRRSVGRYRNYERHLGALLGVLGSDLARTES